MKRSGLIILFICLLYGITDAQTSLWKMRRYEAYAGIGPSFFFGDVGGYSKTKNILGIRDVTFLQTRFQVNFGLKYRIAQTVNIRLSLTYGLLHATDVRGSNENRDFASRISVVEPAILGEYYFLKNMEESNYLFSRGRGSRFQGIINSLDFYAFTGIGGLSYSVKANDNLLSHGLDPTGITLVIPVGLGSTMIYSPNFNFGVELSGRYSFSDNLDGYTSQYSSSNDVYYFLNFTITYKLKTGRNGLPSFRK